MALPFDATIKDLVEKEVAKSLLQGVQAMRESSTYQAIIEEGKAEGKAEGQVEALHRSLLRLGQQRFGSPGQRVKSALLGVTDPARLERMMDRILTVAGWSDLLETP